ncbi:MAG: 16S rRNA processing protein RimM [Erysipelotrichaceae bacterium]|nr:16S rRNA processing protein RimM [Erysipelotrichaceae bacterium]
MDTVSIGKIVKPHGVRGEVKILSSSDFIMERLKKNAVVILCKNGKKEEKKVLSARMHQQMALAKLEGIESMDDAEVWRDAEVLVDKKSIPNLKDGFYFFQLKGLNVYSQKNEFIGVVSEIVETYANNNLRIKKTDGSECLVPYVEAFIKEVNLEENKIIIQVIEGLL